MFVPTSVGLSKFGAAKKASTPVVELIVNFAESAPPEMLYVSVAPASGSVPVTACTAVWFSAAFAVAALVTDGASFTFVTVTATACVADSVPSLTRTVTS